ncbi:MAG: hypothetical protein VX265_12935 [Myxococcota bacterium]|nr:hypothetical protein [Myxococcota bacterium]
MIATLLIAAALSPTVSAAEWTVGGHLQTDIRYYMQSTDVGTWYNPLGLDAGFSRNQNLLKGRVLGRGDAAQLVVDTDFVLMGFPDAVDSTFALSRREILDPFRFEVHEAYMEVWDVGVEGLDLRVGQQKIQWGVGDQFNPTNNLNADDLEDPLLFGDQLGNVMVRADYTPIPELSFAGVLVPIFKPALLPGTGDIALGLTDRVPVQDARLRRELYASNALVEQTLGWPAVVDAVTPVLPDPSIQNMQWQARVAAQLGMQDVALSYYDGRFDFPIASGNHTTAAPGQQCNPNDEEDCINGLMQTTAEVSYPEMQVYGLNATGEVNALGWLHDTIAPIGYRLELAWIHPEETRMYVSNDLLDLGIYTQEAGEYPYDLGGRRPITVPGDDFFKWSLGLDYTFGSLLYVNAQWVHGMPDEFGAGDWLVGRDYVARKAVLLNGSDGNPACNLLDVSNPTDPGSGSKGETCVKEWMRPRVGDYAVVGTDVRWNQGRSLLRIFAILDMTPILITAPEDPDQDYATPGEVPRTSQTFQWSTGTARSMVLYPELSHKLGNGFEMAAGAVVMVGEPWTKFGDPATGGTQVFTRAKYAF